MQKALEYAQYSAKRYGVVMLIVLFAPNDFRAIPEECNNDYPIIKRIEP